VDLIGSAAVPYMARRPYVIEVKHFLLWGLFAGLVEGTVSAVVVSKTFHGSNLLITVVQATPAFANLVSLIWGAMIVGRKKIPAFLAFAAASVAVTLSIAFTPHTWLGGWLFALQICLSRVFMSGVVTTRASLWKSNYPRSHRGRITANLQIVRTMMSLPVILGGGLLFDFSPEAYHWFYPLVATTGALGLLVLRGERVRGERKALRPFADAQKRLNGRTNPAARPSNGETPDDEPIADTGVIAPYGLVAMINPLEIIQHMRGVLREDPRFARYCTAQMCIGTANLMAMPVNTILLTKVLHLSYTWSNGLLDLVPRAITLLMLPVWARLFDRVGVLRFRMTNSLCWCGSLLFCGFGAMFAARAGGQPGAILIIALSVYALGRIFEGLAQSGGAIAWNIGHLHFADDHKAELYMGIHVSLTGFRGLFAPFLGSLLYAWIDWWVFMIGVVISFLGYLIFAKLAREEHSAAHPA
jgi:MFS family permease